MLRHSNNHWNILRPLKKHRNVRRTGPRQLRLEALDARQLLTATPYELPQDSNVPEETDVAATVAPVALRSEELTATKRKAAVWGLLPLPGPAKISITDAKITEGDAGFRIAEFTVTASGYFKDPATVRYVTQPSNATEGVDYLGTSGLLTFQPSPRFPGLITPRSSSGTQTIRVHVLGDKVFEGAEQFLVLLTAVTNANVTDGTGLGTIIDNEINLPPKAVDDRSATTGAPVVIDVLANDVHDGNIQPLSIKRFTQSTQGTVEQIGNALKFTPKPSAHGVAHFTYTISDGQYEATADVNVDVNCIDSTVCNHRPHAEPDQYTVQPGKQTLLDPLSNDSDRDGDRLTIVSFTPPVGGTLSLDPRHPNKLYYTPDVGFESLDSFTYVISDGKQTSSASVKLTVNSKPRHKPVAVNDAAPTIGAGDQIRIPVLKNDHDPDGDPIRILSFDTLDNRVTRDADGGTLVFSSKLQDEGPFIFTYRVTDDRDGDATATVTVNVQRNVAPVAVDDLFSTAADHATLLDLLLNDSDANGHAFGITHVDAPKHGTIERIGGANQPGHARLRYRPNAGFHGIDTLRYKVTDVKGAVSGWATVKIDVGNRAPAVEVDRVETRQGQAVEIRVLANDSDADGDRLEVVKFGQPAHGTVERRDSNRPNVLIYRPQSGFAGEDTFTYTVSDGRSGQKTASVRVTVRGPVSLPARPTQLVAKTIGQNALTVSWNDKSNNETAFRIAISLDGENWNNAGTVEENGNTFRITGLRANTRYFVKVRAVNDAGFSDYSNVLEVRTKR
jgi:hypothetical protein